VFKSWRFEKHASKSYFKITTINFSDGFLITCSGCKNNVIGTKRDIKEIVKIVTKHQNDLNFGSKFKLRK
jgi:hypothetical protein